MITTKEDFAHILSPHNLKPSKASTHKMNVVKYDLKICPIEQIAIVDE